MVYTVDLVYTAKMIYTIDMVYTVDLCTYGQGGRGADGAAEAEGAKRA